jgi:hypothetical protein
MSLHQEFRDKSRNRLGGFFAYHFLYGTFFRQKEASMKQDKKLTGNKTFKENQKSQVRDTAGGEMPDPDQKNQGMNRQDVENAFNSNQNKRTTR